MPVIFSENIWLGHKDRKSGEVWRAEKSAGGQITAGTF
jgi:hypothetical protein